MPVILGARFLSGNSTKGRSVSTLSAHPSHRHQLALGAWGGNGFVIFRDCSLELFFEVMDAVGVLFSLVDCPVELGRERFEFGSVVFQREFKVTQAVLAGGRDVFAGFLACEPESLLEFLRLTRLRSLLRRRLSPLSFLSCFREREPVRRMGVVGVQC